MGSENFGQNTKPRVEESKHYPFSKAITETAYMSETLQSSQTTSYPSFPYSRSIGFFLYLAVLHVCQSKPISKSCLIELF